ncbi:MAG: hypothetical protein R6U96_18015 [Promethearchaeia archaeon]
MTLRLCPKCKRPTLRPATNVSGWLAPEMYRCTNCNYVGHFYVEVESEDYKQFQEEQKKSEKEEITKKTEKNERNNQKN